MDLKTILRDLQNRKISPEEARGLMNALKRQDETVGDQQNVTPKNVNTVKQPSTAFGKGEAIAIVGISGRFPGSANMEQYWDNLYNGVCSIKEVPDSRWDMNEYYDREIGKKGKIYCRSMGMLDHVECFDPLLFEITPVEAEAMDPQHRIFLEEGYKAFEDAGYCKKDLNNLNCGVYLGIVDDDYSSLGESNVSATGNSNAIGAARIAYYLNLKGPAIAIDTACSSSMVGVHLAVTALSCGDIDMALVGGVCLYLTPESYVSMCEAGMLSPDGRCKTFDNDANGFVPGEGAGALVLKRLRDAERDNDHIYACIVASGMNQDGRTNGITAPNMGSQQELESSLYAKKNIAPDSITYAEFHGTGTKLGDPIELEALAAAFREKTGEKNYCAIGSVKSNIGHTSAAGGIAGIEKILLCMKHKELVPTLHVTTPNEHFDFGNSPFYINKKAKRWESKDGGPLRACISSFGFSGTNVHLVLEEYKDSALSESENQKQGADRKNVFTLSAKNQEQLAVYARDILDFIHNSKPDADSFFYTLQTGREPMEDRLAIVVNGIKDLEEKLRVYLSDGCSGPSMLSKHLNKNEIKLKEAAYRMSKEAENRQERNANASGEELIQKAQKWVNGEIIDWCGLLYGGKPQRKMPLPTYPFEKKAYWLKKAEKHKNSEHLHPLLHRNISDFTKQCFRSDFTGREFFIAEHKVGGGCLLPGAAMLEMARVAGALSSGGKVTGIQDVIWLAPVEAGQEGQTVTIRLSPDEDGAVFDITKGGYDAVCAEGRIIYSSGTIDHSGEKIALGEIKQRCLETIVPDALYSAIKKGGIHYGESFRGITELNYSTDEALARICLTDYARSDQFVLNPAILDAAMQTTAVLVKGGERDGAWLPFVLNNIHIYSALPYECYAYVKRSAAAGNNFDITVCGADGAAAAKISGLGFKQTGHLKSGTNQNHEKMMYLVPEWKEKPLEVADRKNVLNANETVIVLSRDSKIAEALRSSSDGRMSGTIISVLCGDDYKKESEAVYKVNPCSLNDFHALFADLRKDGRIPSKIVCDLLKDVSFNTHERLKYGFESMFCLSKALTGLKLTGNVTLLYLINDVGPGIPEDSALGGLFRAIHTENARLDFRTVEIAPGLSAGAAANIASNEFTAKEESSEVNYTGEKRLVKGFAEFPGKAEMSPGIKAGGVYLITGGLGALGMLTAKHVAGYENTKIILSGRRKISAKTAEKLKEITGNGVETDYIQADISKKEECWELITGIKKRYGHIDGIFHAAGIIKDSLLWKKTMEDVHAVFGAKIFGTKNIDEALGNEPVDFIVLYSSLASVLGNIGQCDYCYGNSFMDNFAACRNALAANHLRKGKTVSINWAYWSDGGMNIDAESQKWMKNKLSIVPINGAEGMEALETALAAEIPQLMVLKGNAAVIKSALMSETVTGGATPDENDGGMTAVPENKTDEYRERTEEYLKKIISFKTKIRADMIDCDASFGDYGIDSIMILSITRTMEETFGDLPKTLFFEYNNVGELAEYFIANHAKQLRKIFAGNDKENSNGNAEKSNAERAMPEKEDEKNHGNRFYDPCESSVAILDTKEAEEDDIAIVGISGKYPKADNLDEFWENLKNGVDCITEIPKERWDYHAYFDADKNKLGKTYSKWGGFISGADQFDTLFFGIPPVEAELLDPQARLFLESAWHAMEDAGYTRASLSGLNVGVYVGVMYGMYQLYEGRIKDAVIPANSSYSGIANRVSYFFDFHGPSMAVDTMCSSSLTALHLACESLKKKETDMAFVGGVNLSVHPNKYLILSFGKFASSDGKCRSFGEGGDGYVPGEGVGTVIIRPLKKAIQNKDHIYGVIKGSAINAAGKTSGFTVPSPAMQSRLISSVLDKAGIDAQSVSYIEAHGTGTSLGDPIEINGLNKAFGAGEAEKQYCAIGSVKSNIGHLESASGVAGLTKILLQMQHRQLVPSLHSAVLNPYIDFKNSPFYVQQRLADWKETVYIKDGKEVHCPRRAGISSFGAGGANAHVLVEEYTEVSDSLKTDNSGERLYLFSARSRERLEESVELFVRYLQPKNKAGGFEEIKRQITKIFADEAGIAPQEIHADCDIEEYGLHPAEITEFQNWLLQDMELNIRPEMLARLHTITKLTAYIEAKTGAGSGASEKAASPEQIAFILQCGREAMEERLAVTASSLDALASKLAGWLGGDTAVKGVFGGNILDYKPELAGILKNALKNESLTNMLSAKEYKTLASLWTKGAKIDWRLLYGDEPPYKISLPVYPFAKERYWVKPGRQADESHVYAERQLNPVLHKNVSDVFGLKFCSEFTGNEPFLRDHKVAGQRVLPGVVYLEMVRSGVYEIAGGLFEHEPMIIRNIAWITPAVADSNGLKLFTQFKVIDHEEFAFTVYSLSGDDGQKEVVHCEGSVSLCRGIQTENIDRKRILSGCVENEWKHDGIYRSFRTAGIEYGPGMRGIESLFRTGSTVTASLSAGSRTDGRFFLIPCIMDSALQSAAGFGYATGNRETTTSGNPALPFAIDEVRIYAPCKENMWAVLHEDSTASRTGLKKVNIDICDADGNVCVKIKNLTFREYDRNAPAQTVAQPLQKTGRILFVPAWKAKTIEQAAEVPDTFRKVLVFYANGDVPENTGGMAGDECEVIALPQENISLKYTAAADRLLAAAKQMTERLHGEQGLLQVCVYASALELRVMEGLSGFLKAVQLENPHITGQMIVVENNTGGALPTGCLNSEAVNGGDLCVRYRAGARYVRIMKELSAESDVNGAGLWEKNGVYLITGGAGGLGTLMAKEIAVQASGASVILTGRSERDINADPEFSGLIKTGLTIDYRKADVSQADSVKRLMEYIMSRYGRLDGIIHAAGMAKDTFFMLKNEEELHSVFSAKVTGLYNIDRETAGLSLKFILLMSSSAAVMGNVGQSDYAAANGFMDCFAEYRNALCEAGKRSGRTYSVNWPLWNDGGMRIDSRTVRTITEETGLVPLETDAAIAMMYGAVSTGKTRFMPLQGDTKRIRDWVNRAGGQKSAGQPGHDDHAKNPDVQAEELRFRFLEQLKGLLSAELDMPAEKIDARLPLENYGLTSVMILELTAELEKKFGSLSKTLFFEYQNLKELSAYFCRAHKAKVCELLGIGIKNETDGTVKNNARGYAPASVDAAVNTVAACKPVQTVQNAGAKKGTSGEMQSKDGGMNIAVIGMAGQYPEAENIEMLWNNLKNGIDCIKEIPKERWDHSRYYDPDKSRTDRTYAKYGGFLDAIEYFDPLFFHISPAEAETMDPQERLFLQCVYHAVEDAGYTPYTLSPEERNGLSNHVGVFVGVMYEEYQLYGAQAQARGTMYTLNGSEASIANRVSYLCGFHGPSMSVDSMCSSSLTSLHLACKSILNHECDVAVAGGINLSLHPNKFLMLGQSRFVSSKGRCETFGEGGDGYVPGEGVGAVILKPLGNAVADGDHIYGVIQGTAVNHDGKTNGYTVPNPRAQTAVIKEAWNCAGINPETISYIEAHGTGTSLGDPIEITGLKHAFETSTGKKQFCHIGSVKSNIGHCEGAAGVAGLTKVLLQMRYGMIAPSLHSSVLNPNIDFKDSPFTVPQRLTEWKRSRVLVNHQPVECSRIAGISAFGAGGSNAHVVVEEYIPQEQRVERGRRKIPLIVLSARTKQQLAEKAVQLSAWLEKNTGTDLTDVAYTLLVGRDAMEEKAAFLYESVEDMKKKLALIAGGGSNGIYMCRSKNSGDVLSVFDYDSDMEQLLEKWVGESKFAKLAGLWVKGLAIEWRKYFSSSSYKRISLPGYPFAKERCWAPDREETAHRPAETVECRIHPVIHRNVSDFKQQRYETFFDGNEPFLGGHVIGGIKTLPAVVFLEMVYEALLDSLHTDGGDAVTVQFEDTAWLRPCVVTDQALTVYTGLRPEPDGKISFRVYSENMDLPDHETEYCTGKVWVDAGASDTVYDVEKLREIHNLGYAAAGSVYDRFQKMGLAYGPGQRGIAELSRGKNSVLARLVLPEFLKDSMKDYTMYPAVMDSALQASIGMMKDSTVFAADKGVKNSGTDEATVPFMLHSLTVYGKCTFSMWAVLKPGEEGRKADACNIDICDNEGNVRISIGRIMYRRMKKPSGGGLILVPYRKPVDQEKAGLQFAHRRIVLCNMDGAVEAELSGMGTFEDCISIQENAGGMAEKYKAVSLKLYNYIKNTLMKHSNGSTLIQVVVPEWDENRVFAGLSGMLKTVGLENPAVTCQLVGIKNRGSAAKTIAYKIEDFAACADAGVIEYDGENSFTVSYKTPENLPQKVADNTVFRDQEVYLITGGFGGLGMIFAKEIACRTRNSVIVLAGRSKLTPEKQAKLDELNAMGIRCVYFKADISSGKSVEKLIEDTLRSFGRLDGIIHSAGIVRDHFIYHKDAAEFEEVQFPKVYGAESLDKATKNIRLRFFVLFSSFAAVTGNAGQADYAAANSFLDFFSDYRNTLVSQGSRSGKTISFNWPFWKDGGMRLDSRMLDAMKARSGMDAMETKIGLDIFYRAFGMEESQIVAAQGDEKKILSMFESPRAGAAVLLTAKVPGTAPVKTIQTDESMREAMRERLLEIFSGVLRMPQDQIAADAPFEQYGIDSIFIMKLTDMLEKDFGPLSKTLLFECQTIDSLTEYFIENHRDKAALFGRSTEKKTPVLPSQETDGGEAEAEKTEPERKNAPSMISTDRFRITAENEAAAEAPESAECDIAIIGISGAYAQADNLDELWRNLCEGRDCVTEIPGDRWDYRKYFNGNQDEPFAVYSKWGGFLNHVDQFDPLFFHIAPKDAEIMEPQERLFLETAYKAIEDAGYTKKTLGYHPGSKVTRNVGVFVGVMNEEYQLYAAQEQLKGHPVIVSGNPSSVANRLSYYFDFHGPSIAVDTMCSSSLVALHLACQAIKNKECGMAVVGGVNVLIHPNKYLTVSLSKFASTNGKCMSFGKGGDGYVPGEGAGAVLIKPKNQAVADGDHIYGVIKGTSVNHGGKTNGYTVPNPAAQAEVIHAALERSGINARTISCLEAHGTGTSLGDPIEISALNRAFGADTKDKGFCSIGSIKSNIGHCESSSGMAAIAKVILQLEHKKLVPSIHSDALNPNIDFKNTPFYVQHTLEDWERPVINLDGTAKEYPRTAGISSFGAGGTNAHVIIEEYMENGGVPERENAQSPVIVVLSAKTENALKKIAQNLIDFINSGCSCRLEDFAYTLQTGREEFEERAAFVTQSYTDFKEKLAAVAGKHSDGDDLFQGKAYRTVNPKEFFESEAEMRKTINQLCQEGNLAEICRLWIKGLKIDFSDLWNGRMAHKISLPTYPFENESYWIPIDTDFKLYGADPASTKLHPLVHENRSTLYKQCFVSKFDGNESFIQDHRVGGRKVLPGSAILEMIRFAGEYSLEEKVTSIRNVVWMNQIAVNGPQKTEVKVKFEQKENALWCGVMSGDDAVCAEGYVEAGANRAEKMGKLDVQAVMQRCTEKLDGEACYSHMEQLRLNNGETFRVIKKIFTNGEEAAALLKLPEKAEKDGVYAISPALMNGVFQSVLGLLLHGNGNSDENSLLLPFALEKLELFGPFEQECTVYITGCSHQSSLFKFNILVTDMTGHVFMKLTNFTLKAVSMDADGDTKASEQYYAPCWAVSERQPAAKEFSENAVLVFDQDTEIFNSVKEKILRQDSNERAILITPGTRYSRPSKDNFELSFESQEDFGKMLSELRDEGLTLGRMIFHGKGKTLDERLKNGVYALFRLSKELMKQKLTGKIRMLFAFDSKDAEVIPEYGAIGGLAKTIHMENPTYCYKAVELHHTRDRRDALPSAADLLWSEFSYPDDEVEVCYNDGVRMTKRVEKVQK